MPDMAVESLEAFSRERPGRALQLPGARSRSATGTRQTDWSLDELEPRVLMSATPVSEAPVQDPATELLSATEVVLVSEGDVQSAGSTEVAGGLWEGLEGLSDLAAGAVEPAAGGALTDGSASHPAVESRSGNVTLHESPLPNVIARPAELADGLRAVQAAFGSLWSAGGGGLAADFRRDIPLLFIRGVSPH